MKLDTIPPTIYTVLYLRNMHCVVVLARIYTNSTYLLGNYIYYDSVYV